MSLGGKPMSEAVSGRGGLFMANAFGWSSKSGSEPPT